MGGKEKAQSRKTNSCGNTPGDITQHHGFDRRGSALSAGRGDA